MMMDSTSKDQNIFNKDKLQIITERVDDVPLLIAQMVRMGIPEIIDRHIPRQGRVVLAAKGYEFSRIQTFQKIEMNIELNVSSAG